MIQNFIKVVAELPDSIHDAFIWRHPGINQKISLGEIPTIKGWFLVNSGCLLQPNLLTPILSPAAPGECRYWGIQQILITVYTSINVLK